MFKSHLGHVDLVDDNPDIRLYLSDLLRQMGYSLTSFDTADAFLKQSAETFPAVLVLDVCLPGMTGVELQAVLQSMGRQTPIVFISVESKSEDIIQAMKGQPIEFLWKPFSTQVLVDAIERGMALDRANREALAHLNEMKRRWACLTDRERAVFMCMIEGHTNKGIAALLGVLPDTVKKHRANVLQKMEADQLAQLLRMCKGLDFQQF